MFEVVQDCLRPITGDIRVKVFLQRVNEIRLGSNLSIKTAIQQTHREALLERLSYRGVDIEITANQGVLLNKLADRKNKQDTVIDSLLNIEKIPLLLQGLEDLIG